MKAVFKTDQGKVRQHNEDNGGVFHNPEGVCLAIVADGMGGHRAGDVASSMTVEYLSEEWQKAPSIQTAHDAENWLKEHIAEVNKRLFLHSEANIECQGMGTTVVAAICTDRFSTIANIGDSRCYLANETGFKQLTEDHSLVNELVRSGQITEEDAEHHPRKNVLLRALGTEMKVEVDIITVILDDGDILLLCSDGLSNKISMKDLSGMVAVGEDIEPAADALISLANQNGGEDNITLALVQFSDESESR